MDSYEAPFAAGNMTRPDAIGAAGGGGGVSIAVWGTTGGADTGAAGAIYAGGRLGGV